MTDSGTQENTMKLGGGTANGMRALGYQVLPPNTDSTCWRMITPQGPHTEHLAADEAEGWCKAEQHWQASSVYNALRRTPPTPATDEREAVALAMLNGKRLREGWPITASIPEGFADGDEWRLEAQDALSALAPIRAAEILAAEANERARIATYLNMRAEQWRDLAVAHSGDALKWADCSARENELLRQAIAIEPNEHGAGK